MNNKIVLQARNLHKHFQHPTQMHILKGIDLTVHRGEAVAITGRSGEGKSTLLQVLGTLENPSQGILEIADLRVSAFNRTRIRNRHLAFIFQSFHLLNDYTALENVVMPAKIGRYRSINGTSIYDRGYALLESMGLSSRAHFHTKLLSGGEKQRVAIARALCNDPDLILADEPSGNLDKQTAETIHAFLLDFARKHNKSVVIVTHDQALANLCDKQYVLHDGKLHRMD